jgi:two-component sensor histidine kinase
MAAGSDDSTAPEQHWSSRFNGLRGRMALLLLAVLAVPTAYAVVHAVNQYTNQSEAQRRELQRTARLIADARANTLSSLQTWLEQNARLEAPPTHDPRCNEHLATEREQSDLVTQLTLAEIEGEIVCSANLNLIGLDVGDSYWFQRAARGNPFTISELLGNSPELQFLVAAVPAYIEEGWHEAPWVPAGVLSATLDLQAFSVSPASMLFPRDTDIYLVDRMGKRVPEIPFSDSDVNASAIDALLRGEFPTVELSLPDERTSLLATANIGFSGLKVVVAREIGPLDWLRPDVLIPILLPPILLIVGVIATFAGTHLVVNRHVERLARAVRRYRPGAGDLATATVEATANAPNELSELGTRFAELAAALEAREAALKRAVAQKDLLLREVNHRVKNNLQVVASLLRMRARSGQTAESRAAIRDAHARIEAIALVHRRIYEEGAVEEVELGVFLGELIDHLRKSLSDERLQVTVTGGLDQVRLATDRAVSLALLVTELVSNAIEHGFPDGRCGRIEIAIVADDGGITLSVSDDGIGFDHEAEHDGTGINLAELLARQLGGELAFEQRQPGTRVTLRLPDETDAT